MTYGVINTWGTEIHGESSTRDCSVESSIRPPATRELIVLMIASPTSDAARLLSWIGSSIVWECLATKSFTETEPYPAFPDQSFECVLLLAKARKVLVLFCSHLIDHKVHTHCKPDIQGFVYLSADLGTAAHRGKMERTSIRRMKSWLGSYITMKRG